MEVRSERWLLEAATVTATPKLKTMLAANVPFNVVADLSCQSQLFLCILAAKCLSIGRHLNGTINQDSHACPVNPRRALLSDSASAGDVIQTLQI